MQLYWLQLKLFSKHLCYTEQLLLFIYRERCFETASASSWIFRIYLIASIPTKVNFVLLPGGCGSKSLGKLRASFASSRSKMMVSVKFLISSVSTTTSPFFTSSTFFASSPCFVRVSNFLSERHPPSESHDNCFHFRDLFKLRIGQINGNAIMIIVSSS